MSTRCNIEIYEEFKGSHNKPVYLYHHSDGYPSFQLGKLDRFLKDIFERLKALGYPYWWDGCRVSAMMVMLSAGNYNNPEVVSQERIDKMIKSTDWRAKTECHGYPVYQPTNIQSCNSL